MMRAQIIHLDVSQNQITHVGAKILFQSLFDNQNLVSLNLGNKDALLRNSIGPKGAKYLKDLLIENKFLTFLNVTGNVLCDQGIYQLSQGL